MGGSASATTEELRRAYLRRARQLHPDQFVGHGSKERARAERRMQELNAAWSVLSDNDARRAYDASLRRTTVSGGTSPIVTARREGWKPFDSSAPAAPRPDLGPAVARQSEMKITGPAKLLTPARLLALGVTVVGLVVAASFFGGDTGQGSQRSTVPVVEPTGVPIGCIALAPITEEVPCGKHDAVVWSTVAANETCPDNLESIYRQGIGGLYCITRVD